MSHSHAGAPGIPAVTAADVPEDAYVLDVREPDEWAAGHIPWAAHIPLAQVPERLDEVPAEGRVVVVCRSGGRSAQATAYLLDTGRDAVNLEGGMQRWHALGRHMSSESVIQPSVM